MSPWTKIELKLQYQLFQLSGKNSSNQTLNSGATPKRAKLNRLKLQQSADISLSVIESDDENSDPNRNPANAMDVSY